MFLSYKKLIDTVEVNWRWSKQYEKIGVKPEYKKEGKGIAKEEESDTDEKEEAMDI